MNAAIIGGAIAAVIGAVGYALVGLWLEHRREKAQQLAIVDALIIETAENLKICKNPVAREMWWLAPYKLEAYHAHKGQLLFLPKDVRTRLATTVFVMEGVNIAIQVYLSRVAYGQTVIEKTILPEKELVKHLGLAYKALRKWRKEHTR